MMQKLIEQIKRHEGYRDHVYLDTLGNPTCGWGHHLYNKSRINEVIAEEFLKMDIADTLADFRRSIAPEYRKVLNENRARVITNMIFNMGIQKVLGFRKMWEAIKIRDFDTAAKEMLDSRWADQVGNRAVELAKIMREGEG
jgi:lysozyme